MNTLLMGLRATGKSTVGRRLAERLGRPFIDLDDVTLGQFDLPSISDVWAQHGEAGWRAAEQLAVQRLLEHDGQIIALGGGTPCIAEVAEMLDEQRQARRAVLVLLDAPTRELARRLLEAPGDRPSLTGAGLVEEIDQVRRERAAQYRRLADLEVDVAAGDVEMIVATIIERLDEAQQTS